MKSSRASDWLSEVKEIAGFSVVSDLEDTAHKFIPRTPYEKDCRSLETTDEQLKAIANTSDLAALKELRISRGITIPTNMCLSSFPDLSRLESLLKLDLSYNMMGELEITEEMPALEILTVSHNCIKYVKGLEKLPKLKALDLSHNLLEEFMDCGSTESLIELDLSHNMITAVEHIDAANYFCLRKLKLEGNAVENIEDYREKVLTIFPNLQKLDREEYIAGVEPELKSSIQLNEKALVLLLKHREEEHKFTSEKKEWEDEREKILDENRVLKEELQQLKFTQEKSIEGTPAKPKQLLSPCESIRMSSIKSINTEENVSELLYKTVLEIDQSLKTSSKADAANASSFVSAASEAVNHEVFWQWVRSISEQLNETADFGPNKDLDVLQVKINKLNGDIEKAMNKKADMERVISLSEETASKQKEKLNSILKCAVGVIDTIPTKGHDGKQERIVDLLKRITFLKKRLFETELKKSKLYVCEYCDKSKNLFKKVTIHSLVIASITTTK